MHEAHKHTCVFGRDTEGERDEESERDTDIGTERTGADAAERDTRPLGVRAAAGRGVKNEREEKDYGLSGGVGAVKGRKAGPMGRGGRDERNTGSTV